MKKNPSGKPTPYRVRYYSPATGRVEYVANQRMTKANAVEVARLLDFEGFERIEVSFYAPELGRTVPVEWQKKNPIRDDHTIAIEGDAGGGWIDSVNYPHENPRGRRRNPEGRSWSGPTVISWKTPAGDRTTKTVRALARSRWRVSNRDVDFFMHKDGRNYVASERTTGSRIGIIEPSYIASALGDNKLALNSYIMSILDTYGGERVLTAIDKAPKL